MIFHTAFYFLTFWLQWNKFSHLWQNLIPKLVLPCEYFWLIKTKSIGLFFPWIPMTYAIIINIGICLWNPSVVSWLGKKGCVSVKGMGQRICFGSICDIVANSSCDNSYVEMEMSKKGLLLKNTDYMDICPMEHIGYAHL